MSDVHFVIVTESHRVTINSVWTNQNDAENAAADIRRNFSDDPYGWRLDRQVYVLSLPLDEAHSHEDDDEDGDA